MILALLKVQDNHEKDLAKEINKLHLQNQNLQVANREKNGNNSNELKDDNPKKKLENNQNDKKKLIEKRGNKNPQTQLIMEIWQENRSNSCCAWRFRICEKKTRIWS